MIWPTAIQNAAEERSSSMNIRRKKGGPKARLFG
jgi:hypothetical protein